MDITGEIKLSFVGDIMLEKEQLEASKKSDFNSIFSNITHLISNSDFSIANLETPIAGEKHILTNHKWSFNSPIEFANSVKMCGFNLVATANNHILDRGVEGAIETVNNLSKINLEQVGLNLTKKSRDNIFIKKIGGVKIAFLSYTYGTNAHFNKHYLSSEELHLVNLMKPQEKNIKGKYLSYLNYINTFNPYNKYLKKYFKDIKRAKKQADIVVMLFHSGGQFNIEPDRWSKFIMKLSLLKGVNVVIGAHPHVIQKSIKRDANSVGFYSLGNFSSYPGSESSGQIGIERLANYSIILNIYIDTKTKKILRITFTPTVSYVDDDHVARVYPIFDLFKKTKDESLIINNSIIVSRILGIDKSSVKFNDIYNFPL